MYDANNAEKDKQIHELVLKSKIIELNINNIVDDKKKRFIQQQRILENFSKIIIYT